MDPEYVVADKIPIDAEELRDVNISKKELNDLVEELMKSLDSVDFDDYESILEIPKPTTSNRQRKQRGDITRTPNSKMAMQDLNEASTSAQAIQELTSQQFQPQNVSTPTTSKSLADRTPLSTANASVQSPMYPYNNSMAQNSAMVNSSQTSASPLKITIPVAALNPYQGAVLHNGVIQLAQFQQIIVTVPTIDIWNRQFPVVMNHMQQTVSTEPITITEPTLLPLPELNTPAMSEPDDVPPPTSNDQSSHPVFVIANEKSARSSKPERSQYINTRYQHNLFRHLSHELPPKKCVAEAAINGFTENQRNIFDQQMRMHLQFATQTFMQTSSHPFLSVYAREFKLFLVSFFCLLRLEHSK